MTPMLSKITAGMVVIASAWASSATTAFAELKACNASRLPITVAVAHKDRDKGWIVTGWWVLEREDCIVLVAGSLKGRELDIYAEGRLPDFWWHWDVDRPHCVTEPKEAGHFLIRQDDIRGDCKAAGYVERNFGRVPANVDDYTQVFLNPYPLNKREEGEAKPKERFWECRGCPEMVVMPAGEFTMGSPDNEPERRGEEGPRHKVTIRERFAVSKGAVTRSQFERFVIATGHALGDRCQIRKDGRWTAEPGKSFRDPGFPQGGNDPAVCLNFEDVKAYLAWLSKQTGKTYRLLSEAEWEYVARAGSDSPFWWGATITPAQANYNGNIAFRGGAKGEFREKTVSAFDSFKLNPWNLFIGEGNAAEWIEDCWNKNYQGAPSDGSAWTKGDCGSHVVRGGSWASDPGVLRSAARFALESSLRSSDVGFRVARPLEK
jgi:formylglycine-generating enzyme required for sulfatase activity